MMFINVDLYFFSQKVCLIQFNAVPLHYQNPPSLSTMLKCAGRFILYYEQQNPISEAVHLCARPCLSLAVKRLDSYRSCQG